MGKKSGLPHGAPCSFIMWETGQNQIPSAEEKVCVSSQNTELLHKSGNHSQMTVPPAPLPLVLRLCAEFLSFWRNANLILEMPVDHQQ